MNRKQTAHRQIDCLSDLNGHFTSKTSGNQTQATAVSEN